MKNLRIFLILTILTIGSGCSSTPAIAPLCIPERPHLESIKVEQLRVLDVELKHIINANDLKLKSHIKLLEELIKAQNNQIGEQCVNDT